jgi:predicted RNase H-like HicB family nuclease
VQFEDYKIVLYRQQDNTWVAEIPEIKGYYAIGAEFGDALQELKRVFAIIEEEYRVKELALPNDTTKIIHIMCSRASAPKVETFRLRPTFLNITSLEFARITSWRLSANGWMPMY